MIIANFDGRNVHTIFDALEFKALISILRQTTATQANKAASDMGKSGFEMSPAEVHNLSKAAVIISKKLLASVTVSGEETEDEVDEEDEPAPAPTKPEWKM